ncbi:MAG: hypothetical protein NTZ61_18595, partial [Proteobacteria bacterium]|nr:hypothetical protein [Pseudomonadota bacterium]
MIVMCPAGAGPGLSANAIATTNASSASAIASQPLRRSRWDNPSATYKPKKDGQNRYPGFQTDKHPDGYCLPCCFDKY